MIVGKGNCLNIDIKVIPKSSRDLIEVCDDFIRVKITAPPVDGKANKAIIKLFSERLCVSKKSVSIIRGELSHQKTISIEGITRDEFLKRIS
jgi:hypothetical protein